MSSKQDIEVLQAQVYRLESRIDYLEDKLTEFLELQDARSFYGDEVREELVFDE